MERFDVSSIKINHLAFKLSKSGSSLTKDQTDLLGALTLQTPTKHEQLTLL